VTFRAIARNVTQQKESRSALPKTKTQSLQPDLISGSLFVESVRDFVPKWSSKSRTNSAPIVS